MTNLMTIDTSDLDLTNDKVLNFISGQIRIAIREDLAAYQAAIKFLGDLQLAQEKKEHTSTKVNERGYNRCDARAFAQELSWFAKGHKVLGTYARPLYNRKHIDGQYVNTRVNGQTVDYRTLHRHLALKYCKTQFATHFEKFLEYYAREIKALSEE